MKLKEKGAPFMKENGVIIAKFILTVLFISIGIWFINHEKTELASIKVSLVNSRLEWVIFGLIMTLLYILFQALIYISSFSSVQCKISVKDAVILFLKRNFISIFLPAGGVASLAFFTSDIEKKGIKQSQIHFGSSVYAFIGMLSFVIVAIPIFIYALIHGTVGSGEWVGLVAVFMLPLLLYGLYRSVSTKGILHRLITRFFPSSEVFLEDIQNNIIIKKHFLFALMYSLLVEFTGIFNLYIAMHALNADPSIMISAVVYTVSVIFLIISPFMRGLGAVELTMSYVLIRYGFDNVTAVSVTFLYRFFEFWLPLFAGIVTFLSKLNKLIFRIIPAMLLLVLGIINIISVITPAISARLTSLLEIIPQGAIYVSNYFVLMAGFFMLVTSAFLLKGLRSAWWFALILSIISIIGHLTKAIDYEEAIVALFVIIILIASRKEYYIKTNPRLRNTGLQTALLSIFAVLLYGIIGFYFLDKKYFNIDFNLSQSIRYTLLNYFLVGSKDLLTTHAFAKDFLLSINLSGLFTMIFLVYSLIKPYSLKNKYAESDFENAKQLVIKYGKSSLDYFKTYADKMLYIPEANNSFVSYKISGNFAVVLEDPVAPNTDEMKDTIVSFEKYCFENGLKSIYYRVPEESLDVYNSLGKKNMFLGQEAIVDLTSFSLEGGSRKSLRNSVHKLIDAGYKSTIYQPPIKDGVLQKIKLVSDEWLKVTHRNELVFSQGIFDWDQLKQQEIITVENPEEKVVAFLNIIPDYAVGDGTYDLIRKTIDSPNGTLDYLLIELFQYLKSKNLTSVNLGFAPMSGIDDPHNFPEKSIKFAYNKIKSFSHYKGLRDFKEKFSPSWHNKYLIYAHDYDLIQMPVVLTNIFKA